MSGPQNPYASAPVTEAATESPDTVRRRYIGHEASVKSVGTLFIIGAILLLIMGVAGTVMAFGTPPQGTTQQAHMMSSLMTALFFFAFGVFQFAVALGLRNLAPWAKTAATILACIGLLGIPIGTLINAYFLYILLSYKGKMVFSPYYKEIIERTPHVKYKTSIVVWIFLGLLLALLAFGIFGAMIL